MVLAGTLNSIKGAQNERNIKSFFALKSVRKYFVSVMSFL